MGTDTPLGIDEAAEASPQDRMPGVFMRLLRRVGIVHATANATGTLIFLGSWAARSRGRHHLGVRLGRLGGVVLVVGGMSDGYMRSDRVAVSDVESQSEGL